MNNPITTAILPYCDPYYDDESTKNPAVIIISPIIVPSVPIWKIGFLPNLDSKKIRNTEHSPFIDMRSTGISVIISGKTKDVMSAP